jgi:hypothetical protein
LPIKFLKEMELVKSLVKLLGGVRLYEVRVE